MKNPNAEVVFELRQMVIGAVSYMRALEQRRKETGEEEDLFATAVTTTSAFLLAHYIFDLTQRPDDRELCEDLEVRSRETRNLLMQRTFVNFDQFLRKEVHKVLKTAEEEPDDFKAICAYMEAAGHARALALMTSDSNDSELLRRLHDMCSLAILKFRNGPGTANGTQVKLD